MRFFTLRSILEDSQQHRGCFQYLHDSNNYIQAGALLAMGIVHSGVRHDCDPGESATAS